MNNQTKMEYERIIDNFYNLYLCQPGRIGAPNPESFVDFLIAESPTLTPGTRRKIKAALKFVWNYSHKFTHLFDKLDSVQVRKKRRELAMQQIMGKL